MRHTRGAMQRASVRHGSNVRPDGMAWSAGSRRRTKTRIMVKPWSAEGECEGAETGKWLGQGCLEMQIGRRAGDRAHAALWLLLGNRDWMWRRGRATKSRNAAGAP
ncbi:unnamed protein product [Chondrus crispus]|uniref:Uncharacterized protein n=1 Tax=Chondrus crispus TaxID=2769 RepID=R7Q8L5_CHOCR|nr:unnamed protein product [Chondrus crispus]CDF34138.1 unnamed protein product [Chondrus crispus]|eukprot:XP_005713957.1 unnamed protein product [Chondrus crispus]